MGGGKMLDILKFAHEKGMEEGEEKGRKEGEEKGRLENAREMLIEVLEESLGIVPEYIADQVMELSRLDTLKRLLKQALKCKEISEFEKMLRLATKQAAG
jgi:predicted transposase YdaD